MRTSILLLKMLPDGSFVLAPNPIFSGADIEYLEMLDGFVEQPGCLLLAGQVKTVNVIVNNPENPTPSYYVRAADVYPAD